jgi:NAD(P)-dependent dehydrogenase (short-subunit alcohol dehydrogenase family)
MAELQPLPLLTEKVVLILGASRGIGEGVARAAFAAGARVVVAARDVPKLEALAAALDPTGERTLAAAADMTDGASVQRAVDLAVERFGRLDVAVNNAGFQTARTPFLDTTDEMFDTADAVNLRGVFVAMKHQARAMLAGGGGAIVNTSSAMGTIAAPFIAPYVATKHGLVGLTKAAAVEFASQGIRVNAVAPGAVMTDLLRLGPASSPEALQRIRSATPMGRLGTVEEVAAAIVWLGSDYASYVTGAVLPVDGGLVVP